MKIFKKARAPKTYLPIVYKTKDDCLGGYVLDIYPEERAHAEADYGYWPSRRVLGEYPTYELAWERLMRRMRRFGIGKRSWIARQKSARPYGFDCRKDCI